MFLSVVETSLKKATSVLLTSKLTISLLFLVNGIFLLNNSNADFASVLIISKIPLACSC